MAEASSAPAAVEVGAGAREGAGRGVMIGVEAGAEAAQERTGVTLPSEPGPRGGSQTIVIKSAPGGIKGSGSPIIGSGTAFADKETRETRETKRAKGAGQEQPSHGLESTVDCKGNRTRTPSSNGNSDAYNAIKSKVSTFEQERAQVQLGLLVIHPPVSVPLIAAAAAI